MRKKGTILGCVLWIAGLAAFITGLNLTGEAKTWLTVGGNIVFLAGLAVIGFLRLRDRAAGKEPADDAGKEGENRG